MIGTCPHCKIRLDRPPFNKRNTNEVLLTLKYRERVDNKESINSFDDLGYCEVCDATKEDKENQKDE